MTVALKVDVDTYEGMRDGVPNLLRTFKQFGIRASFFITYGPDNSGKAILRAISRPGFVRKMLRSNAVKMYGIRTALRGTLLPARNVGSSFPDLVRDIASNGHEVGVHAWDHVRWHDHLPRMSEGEVRQEFSQACNAHRGIIGEDPKSSAAAGWTCTPTSLRVQDEYQMLYHSDTRGAFPFFPVDEDGQHTLQIPTTVPTLDESLGAAMCRESDATHYLYSQFQTDRLNVFTLHAEAEGRAYAGFFTSLLNSLSKEGAQFVRLNEVAADLLACPSRIPVARTEPRTIPGRAGTVAALVTDRQS